MRNILQNYILTFILFLILTGCTTTVNSSRIVPAGYSEITKYKTVAFLNFTGNKGIDVASKLETTVIKAEVNGQKQYNVIDKKNINRILQERQFQMNLINQTDLINFGKLAGVEAIWYGNAQSVSNVIHSYETRSECARYIDGRCVVHREYIIPCENRSVLVTVSPKLSVVSSGKVVYSKDFQEKSNSYYCFDTYFSGQTEFDLYNEALNRVLYKYRLDIAPYIENIKIELMSKKSGTNHKSKIMLKSGIEYAKIEHMEKACAIWETGLKETPASISLNYNLGVCNELSGDYNEALKFYLKAETNSVKPIKTIVEAIDRTKENIENQKILSNQIQ